MIPLTYLNTSLENAGRKPLYLGQSSLILRVFDTFSGFDITAMCNVCHQIASKSIS
jgi:hypothetical protein